MPNRYNAVLSYISKLRRELQWQLNVKYPEFGMITQNGLP